MLNRITFAGSIGRNPELKKTPSGISVVTLDLACERDFKDSDGNKVVDWITTVIWRNNADYVAKYAHKGDKLTVDGKLQSRKWTDKQGQTHVAWEVQAENVNIIGGGKRSGNAETPKETAFNEVQEVDELDLPF